MCRHFQTYKCLKKGKKRKPPLIFTGAFRQIIAPDSYPDPTFLTESTSSIHGLVHILHLTIGTAEMSALQEQMHNAGSSADVPGEILDGLIQSPLK